MNHELTMVQSQLNAAAIELARTLLHKLAARRHSASTTYERDYFARAANKAECDLQRLKRLKSDSDDDGDGANLALMSDQDNSPDYTARLEKLADQFVEVVTQLGERIKFGDVDDNIFASLEACASEAVQAARAAGDQRLINKLAGAALQIGEIKRLHKCRSPSVLRRTGA